MFKSYLFLLISVFIFSSGHSKDYYWNGQIYNDQKVSELITIITTTNPIPSIPTTNHIYPSQASLFRIPAFVLCKKIIVFDGVQPSYESRAGDYETYKNNIKNLTQTDPNFANTELIFCSKWVHLAGAIKEGIEHVKTPFLFIHQHDFVLQKDFDLNGLIVTMLENKNVKHVRLNRGETNTFFTHYDHPVEQVNNPSFRIPLCRNYGWSDNDHVTTLDYYKNFVLPKCNHCAMETELHPLLRRSFDLFGEKAHSDFGTYLYGEITDGGYLLHTNGAGN